MPACIAKGNINTSRVFKPWIQSGPLWIKRSSFSREICHRNRNVNWLTRRRWCGWCYIINDMRATGITTGGSCSLNVVLRATEVNFHCFDYFVLFDEYLVYMFSLLRTVWKLRWYWYPLQFLQCTNPSPNTYHYHQHYDSLLFGNS